MSGHNFKDSLAKGKAGEELLKSLWPDLEQLGGRKSDFRLKSTGEKLELKTDSYTVEATPNFFIERWSDMGDEKPGGPWQSYEHGSRYFAYFYPNSKVLYLFDTEQLVVYLNGILEHYKPVRILNRAWVTVGYKIPRAALAHLYKEFRFDVAE